MFSFANTQPAGEDGYRLISALFLRLLAIIYFIAFYDLTFQITGLVGEQGILPLQPWMDRLLVELGWQAFLYLPTLFWLDQSNLFLQAVAWTGCGLALLLLLNIRPRLSLVLLFLCYLSLVNAGQTFLRFQWDGLLLEAGFLAIFLRPDSRIMIFLFRWLLFRLRFMSGISKLVMGDPSWLGFYALVFYFETQPLPHVGSWYFHNLPQTLLVAATVAVLMIEIIVPFMMFLSRRYRFIAAWLTLGLQLLIMLSSNHNWFNFLSMALCLFLFDDRALRRIIPHGLEQWLLHGAGAIAIQRPLSQGFRVFTASIATVFVLAGVLNTYRMAVSEDLHRSMHDGLDVLQAWHLVNTYHVFPTMTTRLIELKVEGSIDGTEWKPYTFKYRPDDPQQMPQIVLPHQPRLDWMVWFVPLGPRHLAWFDQFLVALLDNSPDVTALLEANPFPDQPPRFIRVHAWQYRFTSPQQRELTGNWWQRDYLGLFAPLPGMGKIDQ